MSVNTRQFRVDNPTCAVVKKLCRFSFTTTGRAVDAKLARSTDETGSPQRSPTDHAKWLRRARSTARLGMSAQIRPGSRRACVAAKEPACVIRPKTHGRDGLVVKIRSRFFMRPRTRDVTLHRCRMRADPVLPGNRYMQIRCGEFHLLTATVHPGLLDLAYIRAILIFARIGRALVCNCTLFAQEANGCRLAIPYSDGGQQMWQV